MNKRPTATNLLPLSAADGIVYGFVMSRLGLRGPDTIAIHREAPRFYAGSNNLKALGKTLPLGFDVLASLHRLVDCALLTYVADTEEGQWYIAPEELPVHP